MAPLPFPNRRTVRDTPQNKCRAIKETEGCGIETIGRYRQRGDDRVVPRMREAEVRSCC